MSFGTLPRDWKLEARKYKDELTKIRNSQQRPTYPSGYIPPSNIHPDELITDDERQQLIQKYGQKKMDHVETQHKDEVEYPVHNYSNGIYTNTYRVQQFKKYEQTLARRCINPITAIMFLVMSVLVSGSAAAMVMTTTTGNWNYFVWLIPVGVFFYVLRKVRINVQWD